MKNSRKASALVAVLALAGCGANGSGADKNPVESDTKNPLAEYMGEGFSSGGNGLMMTRAGGPQESSEEQLAKQRKIEDSTAACMKTAGFDYVAVPPESSPKSKFDDVFKLPPDKFAEQYGYGISTIDLSKLGPDDSKDPNKAIRDKLSATAKKAYDKALNGELKSVAGGGVVALPADGGKNGKTMDTGCRGKAADAVYGKGGAQLDFTKFDSLFKDLDALNKRIEADQRVIDATSAWSDCLADAGHPGFKKVVEPRQQVSEKLDALTGNKKPGTQSPKDGAVVAVGPPSFDKVDSQKLADLRKFEIELAKADQTCKAKVYDKPHKTAQFELEKEFVGEHKAELEAYRDGTANR